MATRYTAKQKATILEDYIELGPAELSRQTGIPHRTLREWAAKAGLTTPRQNTNKSPAWLARHEARKTQIADRLANVVDGIIDDLQPANEADQLPALDRQRLMTAAAIGIDKMNLLSGDVTARTETTEVDPAEARKIVAEQFDELAAKRKKTKTDQAETKADVG